MTTEEYMRRALESFASDPPDSEYQMGYLEALKVFANEALGFKWDDPLLWRADHPKAPPVRQNPILTLIEGGV